MSLVGELLLRIGVDPSSWNDLQSTLATGKSDMADFGAAATSAGQVLDSAFSQPIADVAASVNNLVEALDPVKQAQAELAAAFASTGVSMDTLEASSTALGAALQEMGYEVQTGSSAISTVQENAATAAPALDQVRESAVETGSAFEGLGENLTSMLEKMGLFIGMEEGFALIKDLVKESIDAFGNLQMVTAGMTALTGSVEGATSALEDMHDIASSSVFSFPDLADAAQKMAALGVAAEQIPAAMQAASNAAMVTGNDLNTVASAIDRIFLTGTINPRSLTQLGVSLQDLADAAGISADQVVQAFKGMGAESSDALDILTTAIETKTQDAAAAMAGTLPVAINSLKAEWDDLLEDFGKTIAPDLTSFLQTIQEILPYIEKFGAALTSATLISFSDLVHSVEGLGAELQNIGDSITSLVGTINTGFGSNLASNIVDAITHFEDWAVAIQFVSAALAQMEKGLAAVGIVENQQNGQTMGGPLANLKAQTDALTASVAAEQMANDQASDAEARHAAALQGIANAAKAAKQPYDELNTELYNVGETLDKLTSKLPADFADFQAGIAQGMNFSSLDKQFADLQQQLDRTGENMTDFGQAATDAIQGARVQLAGLIQDANLQKAGDAFDALDAKMQKINAEDLSHLAQQIGNVAAQLQPLGQDSSFAKLDTAINQLGITVDGTTQKMAKDFSAVQEIWTNSGSTVNEIEGAWEKVQNELAKIATGSGGLGQVVQLSNEYLTALQNAGASTSQILNATTQVYAVQLKVAEATGASAQDVLAIGENYDNAKAKLNAFNDASQGLLNLYTSVQKAFGDAWTEFGTGIGDAIAGQESFHQAFTKTLDDLEKSLSELVTKYLLGQLKDAFLQNTNALQDFGNVFNTIFGVGSSGGSGSMLGTAVNAGGLGNLPISSTGAGSVATGSTQVSSALNQMGTGIIGTLENMVSMISQVGQLITGIIGDIEQAHTNTLLDRIELNTRQTATYIGAGGGVLSYLALMLPQEANLSLAFTGWFHDALASLMTTVEDIDSKTSAGGGSGGGSGSGGLDANTIELAVQQALSNSTAIAGVSGSLSNSSTDLSSASDSLSSAADDISNASSDLSDAATTAAASTTSSNTATSVRGAVPPDPDTGIAGSTRYMLTGDGSPGNPYTWVADGTFAGNAVTDTFNVNATPSGSNPYSGPLTAPSDNGSGVGAQNIPPDPDTGIAGSTKYMLTGDGTANNPYKWVPNGIWAGNAITDTFTVNSTPSGSNPYSGPLTAPGDNGSGIGAQNIPPDPSTGIAGSPRYTLTGDGTQANPYKWVANGVFAGFGFTPITGGVAGTNTETNAQIAQTQAQYANGSVIAGGSTNQINAEITALTAQAAQLSALASPTSAQSTELSQINAEIQTLKSDLVIPTVTTATTLSAAQLQALLGQSSTIPGNFGGSGGQVPTPAIQVNLPNAQVSSMTDAGRLATVLATSIRAVAKL